MPPCLTLSNIRYGSRVKWSNPGKGLAPSPTLQCSTYWKGSLQVAFDYSCQLYFYIYIYKYIKTLYIYKKLYIYIYIYETKWINIGMMVRVFANGLGDQGSVPGQVIPKTQKMVLDASLLNTQHYKVRIKGKVEQSRERSCTLPYTLV